MLQSVTSVRDAEEEEGGALVAWPFVSAEVTSFWMEGKSRNTADDTEEKVCLMNHDFHVSFLNVQELI